MNGAFRFWQGQWKLQCIFRKERQPSFSFLRETGKVRFYSNDVTNEFLGFVLYGVVVYFFLRLISAFIIIMNSQTSRAVPICVKGEKGERKISPLKSAWLPPHPSPAADRRPRTSVP